MEGRHSCPVCGQYEFEQVNSWDFCPVCGWMDDIMYEKDPDYAGGFFLISLNKAKELWRAGRSLLEEWPTQRQETVQKPMDD